MIQSFVTGGCFLGTEIDDKLADTLSLGKNVVVTGLNIYFTFSIGLLVTIPAGDLVAKTVTTEIGDVFLDVEIDDKLEIT